LTTSGHCAQVGVHATPRSHAEAPRVASCFEGCVGSGGSRIGLGGRFGGFEAMPWSERMMRSQSRRKRHSSAGNCTHDHAHCKVNRSLRAIALPSPSSLSRLRINVLIGSLGSGGKRLKCLRTASLRDRVGLLHSQLTPIGGPLEDRPRSRPVLLVFLSESLLPRHGKSGRYEVT
jgi:hypothetical protein